MNDTEKIHGVGKYKSALEDKVAQVRKLATGRQIESWGYQVGWTEAQTTDYATDGWGPEAYCRNGQVSLKRYKEGAVSNLDHNSSYYVAQDSDVWNWEYEKTQIISELFAEIGGGHPKKLETLLEDINSVVSSLCGMSDWMDKVDAKYSEGSSNVYRGGKLALNSVTLEDGISEIDKWKGVAATTFMDGVGRYGSRWQNLLHANYLVAETLRAGVEAQIAINASARQDMLKLLDMAEAALLDSGDYESKFTNTAPLAITGAIATASLAIAGFGTASALAGAGFAITQALLDSMDTENPSAGKSKESGIEISVDTISGLLDSLSSAVAELLRKLDAAEEEAVKELEEAYGIITDALSKPMDEPQYKLYFNDDPKRDKAFPDDPDSAESLGDCSVEVTPADLIDAAEDSFPIAVEIIVKANKTLADTAGVSSNAFLSDHRYGTSSVAYPWCNVRDLLQDITAHNAEKLKNAGEVLVYAAIEYADMDEKSAKGFLKDYEDLEPTYTP